MAAYQLRQDELVVQEVMGIHREEGVYASVYPCNEFLNAAEMFHDFRTLVSNARLVNFISDEPYQYAKLTVSVVQDFRLVLHRLTPWFITRFITKLWICLLMHFVQPSEYRKGDRLRK